MVTTIWDHRLHKIDDERNGCGIGRKRDENNVKKELIISGGPQKTGKYVAELKYLRDFHNEKRLDSDIVWFKFVSKF